MVAIETPAPEMAAEIPSYPLRFVVVSTTRFVEPLTNELDLPPKASAAPPVNTPRELVVLLSSIPTFPFRVTLVS